jgi:hypothetical protein
MPANNGHGYPAKCNHCGNREKKACLLHKKACTDAWQVDCFRFYSFRCKAAVVA